MKRNPGGNFTAPAKIHQIIKLHAPVFPRTKRFDGAVCQRAGGIRDNEVQIDADGPPKPPAGITGTQRAVKREKIRQRRIVDDITFCALQLIAEGLLAVGRNPDIQPPAAEAEGQLERIQDAITVFCAQD